jgi:hypothetical protein
VLASLAFSIRLAEFTLTKEASMLVAGNEFPDKCPENCPFIDDVINFGQNAMCTSCPIFVCPEVVPAEHYRKDWSDEWRKFFDGGMKGFPSLKL